MSTPSDTPPMSTDPTSLAPAAAPVSPSYELVKELSAHEDAVLWLSFSAQGHFATGHTDRALELIRRSWGWYLHHPNGTGSTVIEGYLTNGSWAYRNYRGYAYDATYVSHAHGWSSGPTSALTNYVVGLRVTGRLGSNWELAPQFGDLTNAEGGFSTKLGLFSAKWKIEDKGGRYVLSWKVPQGTRGEVKTPSLPAGGQGKVTMGGAEKGIVTKDNAFSITVEGGQGQIEVTRC